MRHPILNELAARYVLGITNVDALKDAAHRLLDNGFYTYALGELATIRGLSNDDANCWLSQLFVETGTPLSSKTEALKTVVTFHMRRMLESSHRFFDSIGQLHSECYRLIVQDRFFDDTPMVEEARSLMCYHYECQDADYLGGPTEAGIDAYLRELDKRVEAAARDWEREIVDVHFDTSWHSMTVSVLASAIRKERAFDRLPILADALEEAGCDNDEILLHLRAGEYHRNSCWVIDRIHRK